MGALNRKTRFSVTLCFEGLIRLIPKTSHSEDGFSPLVYLLISSYTFEMGGLILHIFSLFLNMENLKMV